MGLEHMDMNLIFNPSKIPKIGSEI